MNVVSLYCEKGHWEIEKKQLVGWGRVVYVEVLYKR